MSDFIASQGLGQQPCGSRDDADAPATAALATSADRAITTTCIEHQAGRQTLRLSFQIKVF